MAATYTDDAEAALFIKDQDTANTRQRAPGEMGHRGRLPDFFKDRKSGTGEERRRTRPLRRTDLLIIHGDFTPAVSQGGSFPFVQVRTKHGDKWMILSLQVFVVDETAG